MLCIVKNQKEAERRKLGAMQLCNYNMLQGPIRLMLLTGNYKLSFSFERLDGASEIKDRIVMTLDCHTDK